MQFTDIDHFYSETIYARGRFDKKQTTKNIYGDKKAWSSFIKPGLKMALPLISAAVAAKTKNSQSARITNDIIKSLTKGRILGLTDMQGNGLRLKVM